MMAVPSAKATPPGFARPVAELSPRGEKDQKPLCYTGTGTHRRCCQHMPNTQRSRTCQGGGPCRPSPAQSFRGCLAVAAVRVARAAVMDPLQALAVAALPME